jgi:hypothetical protein
MSFISFTYDSYDSKTDQYIYTIVDSDFGSVEVGPGPGPGSGPGSRVAVGVGVVVGGFAVVREYSKRNLNVGRNLALAVIWTHRTYKSDIADIIRWQDKYCTKYIENWMMYAKERDYHLEKLLAIT